MTTTFVKSLAVALTLGATAIAAVPASAMPAQANATAIASPLITIASGGWASRTSGHRRTYDDAYGYGYEGYGRARGFEGYDAYGYEEQRGGNPYGYGYGYDEGAY